MWVLDLSKFEGSEPYEPVCQWVSQVSQCRDHYHLPSSLVSSHCIPHFLFWSSLLSSLLFPCFFFEQCYFSLSLRPNEGKNTHHFYDKINKLFRWHQELWCPVINVDDWALLCHLLGHQLPIIPYGSPFKPRRGRLRCREKVIGREERQDQRNGLLTNMQSDEWIDHNVD